MTVNTCSVFILFLTFGSSLGLDSTPDKWSFAPPDLNKLVLNTLKDVQFFVMKVQARVQAIIKTIGQMYANVHQQNDTFTQAEQGINTTGSDQAGLFDGDAVTAMFQEFTRLSGQNNGNHMTAEANTKLANDCFKNTKYGNVDVKSLCETSIFPACKDLGKPYMIVNRPNVRKYIHTLATEIRRNTTGNANLDENSAEISSTTEELIQIVLACKPDVKDHLIKSAGQKDTTDSGPEKTD